MSLICLKCVQASFDSCNFRSCKRCRILSWAWCGPMLAKQWRFNAVLDCYQEWWREIVQKKTISYSSVEADWLYWISIDSYETGHEGVVDIFLQKIFSYLNCSIDDTWQPLFFAISSSKCFSFEWENKKLSRI